MKVEVEVFMRDLMLKEGVSDTVAGAIDTFGIQAVAETFFYHVIEDERFGQAVAEWLHKKSGEYVTRQGTEIHDVD